MASNLLHFSIQGRDLVRERSLEGALDQLNARIGLKIDCRVALKKMESFVCTSTRALPRPARQLSTWGGADEICGVLFAPAPGHFRARLANKGSFREFFGLLPVGVEVAGGEDAFGAFLEHGCVVDEIVWEGASGDPEGEPVGEADAFGACAALDND